MYNEVTISDNSWAITLGYELVSIFSVVILFFLSSDKFLKFKSRPVVKTVVILFLAGFQYNIATTGIDYIYRYFGYGAWDDETIRYSSMLFFVVYLFFSPDWKKILEKKDDTTC